MIWREKFQKLRVSWSSGSHYLRNLSRFFSTNLVKNDQCAAHRSVRSQRPLLSPASKDFVCSLIDPTLEPLYYYTRTHVSFTRPLYDGGRGLRAFRWETSPFLWNASTVNRMTFHLFRLFEYFLCILSQHSWPWKIYSRWPFKVILGCLVNCNHDAGP